MTPARNKPRHPAVSDIALALAQRRSDPVSKVSLTLNAKGDVQIEVDVSDTDPKRAADQASVLFTELRERYPRHEPTDAEQAAKDEAKRMGNAARIQAARAKKAERS